LRTNRNRNDLFDCHVANCAAKGDWCGAKGNNVTNCWSPYECITYGTTSGTCQAHRNKGESCTVSSDCYESAVVADGLYCKAGVCAEHATVGQACQNWEDCGDNLHCDNGVCINPFTANLGEPCNMASQCIFTLQCLNDVCTRFRTRGETCDVFQGINCAADYQCVDGICRDWYSAKEGQSCQLALSCVDGLVCGSYGTCVQPGTSAGTPCEKDADCPVNNYCKCDWASGQSSCAAMELVTPALKMSFEIFEKCFITNGYDSSKCKKETGVFALMLPEFSLLLQNPCLTQ